MSLTLSRVALFAAGFVLWTAFSLTPVPGGGLAVREGWDGALYWEAGVPVLLAAQFLLARVSLERAWRQPLWILAGHLAAMLVLRRAGSGFSMAPVAMVFIGLPAYPTLLLFAALGRRFARRPG